VSLYPGDYLPETLYETWAAEERERLAALFLETADRLADALIRHERYNEAIDLSQRILIQDNCWERAYRHLMLAYDRLGDRGQVGRTYQKCVQTLRDELDVSPAQETEKLYESLTA
jgi:LuxR family maltose regulon positive regulatory protein